MLMGSHRDQTWISARVSVLWRKVETAWRESQARFFFVLHTDSQRSLPFSRCIPILIYTMRTVVFQFKAASSPI